MKIRFNLANPPSFRDRYAFILAVPALLIGLLVIALLGRYASKEYSEHAELGKALQQLQSRRAELDLQPHGRAGVVAGRDRDNLRKTRIAVVIDGLVAIARREQHDAPLAIAAAGHRVFDRQSGAGR